MKKLLLLLFVVSINTLIFGQKLAIPLSSAQSEFKLKSSTFDNFTAGLNLKELIFENTSTENGNFAYLEIEGGTTPANVGQASLPVVSKLIEIPQEAEIQIIVNSYETEVVNLSDYGINQIIPTQPSYSKSTPEEEMHFVIDENYYQTDILEENELVISEILGTMRGVRIGRIEIRPYHYNPVENTLVIYNNLDFSVNFLGSDIGLTDALKTKFYAREFEGSYNS
ncbi:MAG: hypothetical protein GX879_01490, partial [Bacteroidales bacterium]|nr:hypothetical protein [Bacteroidales bacterium]